MVWSGVEWSGVEWSGVEWCGVVWYGTPQELTHSQPSNVGWLLKIPTTC